MFRKCFILCLFILSYFDDVKSQDGMDGWMDDGSFIDLDSALEEQMNKMKKYIEDLRLTEKMNSLERTIPNLESNIEKIPEALEKINQRLDALEKRFSEEMANKIAALENKIPNLEQSINRTLADVIEKIPESLKTLTDRLNTLETSASRVTRSTSTERNLISNSLSNTEGSSNTERTVTDTKKDFIESNSAYNEEVFKNTGTELDDLDKSMANKTGCKYLSLKNQDLQTFNMMNQSMSLINSAYQQLATFRNIRLAEFETHLAIRSSGPVYILLWEEANPDLNRTINPDFEIGLGVKDKFRNTKSSLKTKFDTWQDFTPIAMSPNEYKKFYIKTFTDALEFGSGCGETPIHVHSINGKSIMTIGFLAMANDGAKVLLDCPATYCTDMKI